ncbi:unnamed protein product [Medioppia subpectinata]|uniref:Sushi domain-containing protein n=1 Tax=Medioppia subpectinata TaxID=1979941 RepID=A0A7R9Q103_9ACAR|nr:unnamed protein product [Medioppia subpectinata]CAG2108662.1 unnamed protein product [Medioppia subpectinata]
MSPINYGNQSYLIHVEFGSDSSVLPTSKANISRPFNELGAYTPPHRAPLGCLVKINSGDDEFAFDLSEAIEIHYVRIKLYAMNIKHIWLKQQLVFTASFNDYFEDSCRLSGAHHRDDSGQQNDNYLTLEFGCDEPAFIGNKYDRVIVKVNVFKETFSQIIIFHICDLRVYWFDSECGRPDIPVTMDALPNGTTGYEYRCRREDRYFLDGSARVGCNEFGKWTQGFPRCVDRSYCPMLSNDTVGESVDISYELVVEGGEGRTYVPNGMSVRFTCDTIRNSTQNNETHYVLRGPDRVECMDGQWLDLTVADNKPDCRLEIINTGVNRLSVPQYIIAVLSGVLLLSVAVILCLTGFTVNGRRQRREVEARRAKERAENPYDNPYDMYGQYYDDIRSVNNEGSGVYEEIKSKDMTEETTVYDDIAIDGNTTNVKNLYENPDDDIAYEEVRYVSDGRQQGREYLEITDSVFGIQTKQ